MTMRPSSDPQQRSRGFRGFIQALSRRRRPSSIQIESRKEDASYAPSTADCSASMVTEVNIVGFYLNSTLLSKHPMAEELQQVNRTKSRDETKQRAKNEAATRPSETSKEPIDTAEPKSSPLALATSECASSRRDDSNQKSKSPQVDESVSDSIEHCPNVEICLNTISVQEISPVLLVHDMPADASAEVWDKSPSPLTQPNAAENVGDQGDSSHFRQPTHRCQVGDDGIELVPSNDPDHCLPRITELVAARTRTLQSISRGRSYIVKSGDPGDESQVDVESVAVSSLWSSRRDDDSESSYTGTFSSGSGLLEDDMITAYTGDGLGYPNNIYCFAFVDKLDDRVCIGDDDF